MNKFIQGCTVSHGNVLQSDGLLLSYQLFDARGLVWHFEAAELVCDYAQRPHIAFLIVPFLFVPHLGAGVQWRAGFSFCEVAIGHDLRDVHISQFIGVCCCFEDVGGLDVPVYDVVLVQVL